MSELPPSRGDQAEIRTFLIADVRGYTRYTQERGDEAAARLASAFADIVRLTVEELGGRLVELRGDEALVVFASPRQAIRTAVVLQQRFVERMRLDDSLPLRVGIGLDAGEAVVVGEGFRGGALNLAARLCSIAEPGEVLLTESLTHLSRRVDELTYLDRGRRSFKGLEQPVRVFKVEFPLEMPEAPGGAAPGRARRYVLAAVATFAVLVVAAVVAVEVSGGGASAARHLGADSLGAIDPASGKLVSQTAVGNGPESIGVGEGATWVADTLDDTVSRVQPGGGRVAIPVNGIPSGVATGFGLVWVSDFSNRAVERISPGANKVVGSEIAVGNGPASIATGYGAVWVANTLDGTVSRVSPGGRQTDVLPVAGRPDGIAIGGGSVWVASGDTATVTQISAKGLAVVRTIPVGNGATGIVFGKGAVWVANALDGTVTRIDPSSGAVTAQRVATGITSIAVAGDSVWAASPQVGRVYRLDPASGRVAGSIEVGSRPTALTAGSSGPLWVTALPQATAHRGGTLTISTPMSGCGCLDPAIVFESNEWRLLTTMYDGLVAYHKVGGAGGATLVPDLARQLPVPTQGGRVYRFELRAGIRYSDGKPVRAGDVRASFERMLKLNGPGQPFYAAIMGASQCVTKPGACDLSSGIQTDDATGSVTFNLTKPDPDFLYKLSLPMASVLPTGPPVPSGPPSGSGAISEPVIPGTGPYRVQSFAPNRRLVLERNPMFRVYSPDAQPAGYPDRIVAQIVDGADPTQLQKALADVQNGHSDWVNSLNPTEIQRLAISAAGQLHSTPFGGVSYLMLNTRRPPFNNLLARRAISFALDRRKIVAINGDELLAQPTCQVLPPTFQGYRPYCPYTKGRQATLWNGVDLTKARHLAAASGTRGATVNLLGQAGDSPSLRTARYIASVVDQLGYRGHVLIKGDAFGASIDPHVQFAGYQLGWLQDFTAASDFVLPLFSCGALTGSGANVSGFCNAHIDQLAAKAGAEPSAAAAGKAWAQVDRAIVDQAPAVPLYTLRSVDFVSKRVGNYIYNPEYGALLDQLWVR
jgi:ABC-type transport system substrate-binding protein/class 3 adenylate cyclase/streptogramin lyase